ncbi:metal-dependent hydrolase [Rhodopseudomonas boonkerdii]|uniref:amidohydrolase family protein n=1 Tax=Rhodopseudomonas boonkerdii TaxID=475937 RepID=UPI001E2CDC81|nr:amidohydrolase family protein [Rhodopseudomonas boonkerdii]UGV25095.1 metal-dependent hydrolase [Rhodopseudomonas boonkerdii]
MPTIDTLFISAKLPDGTLNDVAVAGGLIAGITPSGGTPAATETIDLGGALVIPSFVEGHIHLDTSFYGDVWRPHVPYSNGFKVQERVAIQADNMAKAAPMAERATSQLELCLGHGSTRMRSHVMVDGSVGLKSLETILAVREAHRELIDVQLVAFPQSGILRSPGTPDLLDAAFDLGADVIGGLDPGGFDRDVEKHLDVVFGIAERRGVDVDIHLHDPSMLGIFEIEQICARTRALGMQGHVAISHAYSLGDVGADVVQRTAETLAASGVAIMTNAPGARPFPPVKVLRAAGVTVFGGCDNIRDSWWPYGDGDMLGRAMMIGYRSGFNTDEDLTLAFDIVTSGGARALRLDDHGLRIGAKADFVAIDAPHVPQAVVDLPKRRAVYKNGRLVARDGEIVRKA